MVRGGEVGCVGSEAGLGSNGSGKGKMKGE